MRALAQRPRAQSLPFDYDTAVDLLSQAGLDEEQVRAGSMPPETLRWIAGHVRGALALHVGNFVGVSLAAFTDALVEHDPTALVVSVDPGMTHRGIEDPQRHALALLDRFGLQANSLVITGFSGAKSPRDDGLDWADAGGARLPDAATADDAACEQVVPNLARLLEGRFDVVLLDGNHDGDYLREELDHVARLLKPGGVVILDDVVEGFWQSIADVFAGAADDERFESLGHDGRAGMLRRR